MRLLFLTSEAFPTFRVDVTVLFGKYMPRHGVRTDLVAIRAAGYAGSNEWGGGEAFICKGSVNPAARHLLTLMHGLRQLFRADRETYDAIQVRDMPLLAVFGLLTARLKGLPFFYWMSYPMPEGHIIRARERGLSAGWLRFLWPWARGRLGHFLLYRLVLPMSTHTFVQSRSMQQAMTRYGVSAEQLTPVPMGVDMEAIAAMHIQPTDDLRLAGRRVLVYLGTLDRVRRIEHLFTMLRLVRQQVPDAMLVLVGDTEEAAHRRWLEEQAVVAGVAEHVLWTGWLPTTEAWRYVCAAQIGLSPIPRGVLLDCGSPTKVPEYLALGIPVVCNDNPDQRGLIEQAGSGRCVEYTPQAFAAAAIELLSERDCEKRRASARGRRCVAKWRSYDVISVALLETYKRLLQK